MCSTFADSNKDQAKSDTYGRKKSDSCRKPSYKTSVNHTERALSFAILSLKNVDARR
jgi:hypothetical protein